jgi:SulP family sulfate permease
LNLRAVMLRRSLRGEAYGPAQFLGDCSGGLVAALIALPYGLAMASLMGLPPVMGVFTSILTAPIIALLGRNPVLIGGTASATVPFIASAVHHQGIGGAAKISIVAAVIMMAFCVLRLGRYITRLPHAVVSGFSCGIGGMMLVSQLDTIFGIASPLGNAARSTGSALGQLLDFAGHLGDMRLVPLILGLTVMIAATGSARLSHRAPGPLIGVVLSVIVARLFGLHEKEVGSLPLVVPPLIEFSWSGKDVFTVLPSAFALAFVSSVNILITSRVVEHFRGRHKPMKPADADAELGAYGIANIFGGMFGAPPSVGIPARSLAVVRCGGVTRLSNLLHAIFLMAILWVGGGFAAHIPIPAIAGVTAWMGLCLLDWSAWRRLPRMSRIDAAAFLATAVSVMMVNAVLAVAIGSSLYLLKAAYTRFNGSVRREAVEPASAALS